ncbi:MAG: glycoside hydrolase family 43 protein [Planctomycetes bacterium]|nr:glycoside hydrolase family 43 protein [Planctomycetota bacterium]
MVKNMTLIAGILCLFGCNAAQITTSKEPTAYLFSYFLDNGQDGLHLAYSHDGLTWAALKNGESFLPPKVGGKLMRDPCICTGPDGEFHMVWTSSWQERGIGVAHSKDLINWSEQVFVPVMTHEPKAHNCWAPEIYYDEREEEYVIYWSTTIPGRFPETEAAQGDRAGKIFLNHRIYCTTTRDFKTYTDTRLFYNDDFNVIDATLAKTGKHGKQYLLFVKDETKSPKAQKNIRLAFGQKAQGPYGPASEPITPTGLWVEGPTALKIDDTWHLYYDAYTEHHYAGLKSKDLKTWQDITDQLHFPKGTRHGTAFEVTESVLDRLLLEQ